MDPMSEQLRQALVDFLNLQGEAVYPTASISLFIDDDGLNLLYCNEPGRGTYTFPDLVELSQFLLEYSIR